MLTYPPQRLHRAAPPSCTHRTYEQVRWLTARWRLLLAAVALAPAPPRIRLPPWLAARQRVRGQAAIVLHARQQRQARLLCWPAHGFCRRLALGLALGSRCPIGLVHS